MIIELSDFNYKFFLPLIFPIANHLQDLAKESYMNEGGDNSVFITFRYFFSYIFAGIFLLILKYNTREKFQRNESVISSNIQTVTYNLYDEIDLTANARDKKIKIKKVLSTILLCILGMSTFFCRSYFYNSEYFYAEQSTRSFCEIVTFAFLSTKIIKQKLYVHHLASLGCIILMLLIIFIISIHFMEGTQILYSFIYYFIISFLFGLYDVLIKNYMDEFYSNPYFMMFIIGLINVIFLLIYEIFAYYLNPNISGIIIGLQKNINSIGKIFLFFLDIILEFIWNLGILLVIYYYTPCHYFISEYISDYIYFIKKYIFKEDESYFSTINIVIFSLCYIINFFCILVFNEVIILNFLHLDYNTRKRIQERVSIDYDSLQSSNIISERQSTSGFNSEEDDDFSNNNEK